MRPFFEDLSCRLRLSPGFPASFPEHLHTQLELVCLFSGRARMLVDGRVCPLEAGDVCLCFPGATHGYAGAEAAEGRADSTDDTAFPSRPKSPLDGVFGFGGTGFSHQSTRSFHSRRRRAK